MNKNKYVVELTIDTGIDNPGIVTSILGIQPTKILKKGEPWLSPVTKQPIAEKTNENNLWIYSVKKVDPREGVYLNHVIGDFIKNFETNSEKLKEVLAKYSVNHLNCVAYFSEYNPYFQIDTELIERLNYYSLKLTFDLYFAGE